MPELRAFTFDRQSAQRIVNAVGVVERLAVRSAEIPNRLVRVNTDAQQHLRVTGDIDSGTGFYPAVVVLYNFATDVWDDLGTAWLKPRDGDTFNVDDRVFCHPIAVLSGTVVFIPVGGSGGGTSSTNIFPAKLNSISGSDYDWTEQQATGDGDWEDKPGGRTGTTATEFNKIPVTIGDVVPMLDLGGGFFRFAYWDLAVSGDSGTTTQVSAITFDSSDFATTGSPHAVSIKTKGLTGTVAGSGTYLKTAAFDSSTCTLTTTSGTVSVSITCHDGLVQSASISMT